MLEPWDAFLYYVVRHVALDGEDAALRQRLFTLLLESAISSWRCFRAIRSPATRCARFSWTRGASCARSLRRVIPSSSTPATCSRRSSAAPGLPVSTDGLRQLAHSRTGRGGRSLAYDWSVDAELSRVFGVHEISETEPAPPPTRSWLDLFIPSAYANTPLDRWVPTRAELPAYEARVGGLLGKTATSELARQARALA